MALSRTKSNHNRTKRQKPHRTTRSRIISGIRLIWLRSPERAARLKMDGYTCQECGAKKSTAKGRQVSVEVHHLDGIPWQFIVDYLMKYIFCDTKKLLTLCKECHKLETDRQRSLK